MTQVQTRPPNAGEPRMRRHTKRRRHRVRRAILLVVVVALIPIGWSYANALTAPGNAPFSARTVEWIKEHGGRGAVLAAERFWYSMHKPPVGGTPSGGIPVQGPHASAAPSGSTQVALPDHIAAPTDLRPFVSNPLPREGEWQTVGRTVQGLPTVQVTFLRPDNVHTSLLTGVIWMDTKLLETTLIPGTDVPGGTPASDAEIPRAQYPQLAAAFNSGFLLKDSNGGFFLNGRTAAPLVDGQASLVIYKDGTVDIGRWGSDVTMTPDVTAVRQNLSMLVSHGQPVAGLANDSFLKWGATLGNQVLVWRSGVGVTADGALVYAAGPGLSVQSLADILARAGAIRAMELDINTEWTSAMYYTSHNPSKVTPHKLLVGMYQGPTRYLIPDQRDFFAMFIRKGLSPD
jgi:hypothetical protein